MNERDPIEGNSTDPDAAAENENVRGVRRIDRVPSASNPGEALRTVLNVLDLKPSESAGDSVGLVLDGQERFIGTSYRPPWQRIFGGQVLAQSLVAALRTVDPARTAHSLHAYFLRPGDPEQPIEFAVERLRDGRSFSARRTHALQRGKPILSMITSFQLPAEGIDHYAPMPDAPDPEDLPSLEDQFGHIDIPAVQQMLRSRPVDLRHVDGSIYISPPAQKSAHQLVWLRAGDRMPDEEWLHIAMLAFVSDYTLLEPAIRAHGLAWGRPGMKVASLDHAMWFHRPARVDEWLLYVQESPSASGARGLALGRLYRRDGVLVASVAQEGMLRVPPK